jgi:HSP20 family protein
VFDAGDDGKKMQKNRKKSKKVAWPTCGKFPLIYLQFGTGHGASMRVKVAAWSGLMAQDYSSVMEGTIMTGLRTLNGSRRLSSAPTYGDPFSLISRDFDRMIGSIFGDRAAVAKASTEAGETETPQNWLSPRIDVFDADDHIELSAELPGVDQEDIDVSVLEGVLTITGEKKSTRESSEGARVVERSFGSFKRSFRLNDMIDADNITASFKNGVLVLTLPKVAEQKPEPRKIAVTG